MFYINLVDLWYPWAIQQYASTSTKNVKLFMVERYVKFRDVLHRLAPYYIYVTLWICTYPNWFGLQFQTSSGTEKYGVFETEPTKQDAQNVNIIHCIKICKIQIYVLHCLTPGYIHITLRVFTYPNWFGLQFQTSSDTKNIYNLQSNYLQFTCIIKNSPYPVAIEYTCCSTNLRNLCMSAFWLKYTRLKQ